MSRLLMTPNLLVSSIRTIRRPRSIRPYMRDLYLRRLAQGPEKYRPRSSWLNWNREAELNAFFHRIGENIATKHSNHIFMDISYKDHIISKGDIEVNKVMDSDNSKYGFSGFQITRHYVLTFLRASYPRFPEEWVVTIMQHLLSPPELAFVGSHLGLKDLILYVDETNHLSGNLVSTPPSLEVISNAFMAVIGVIAEDEVERAEKFIRDFVLTRVAQIDLIELLTIPNPFELLTGILLSEGRGLPEARLQHQSSMNTILACYQVGIYSDYELISEAPGETLVDAQSEAAREAVRTFFGLTDYRPPLGLEKSTCKKEANVSIDYYLHLASRHEMTS